MKLKKISIHRLSFSSYLKFFVLNGVASGATIGVVLFIFGLLGYPVEANVGNTVYTGLVAMIIGLIIGPLVVGLIYIWLALTTYWPFRLLLKIFKKIEFDAFIKDIENAEDSENIFDREGINEDSEVPPEDTKK